MLELVVCINIFNLMLCPLLPLLLFANNLMNNSPTPLAAWGAPALSWWAQGCQQGLRPPGGKGVEREDHQWPVSHCTDLGFWPHLFCSCGSLLGLLQCFTFQWTFSQAVGVLLNPAWLEGLLPWRATASSPMNGQFGGWFYKGGTLALEGPLAIPSWFSSCLVSSPLLLLSGMPYQINC